MSDNPFLQTLPITEQCVKDQSEMLSDTPRTDANIVGKELHSDFAPAELVDANFARQLERELAAEKEKLARWMIDHAFATGHGDSMDELLAELTWQIAERKQQADRARQAAIAEIKPACDLALQVIRAAYIALDDSLEAEETEDGKGQCIIEYEKLSSALDMLEESLPEEPGYVSQAANNFKYAIERLSTLPPTHQVVPVEPTEEMIRVGKAMMDTLVGDNAKMVYKAMLEAARKA